MFWFLHLFHEHHHVGLVCCFIFDCCTDRFGSGVLTLCPMQKGQCSESRKIVDEEEKVKIMI